MNSLRSTLLFLWFAFALAIPPALSAQETPPPAPARPAVDAPTLPDDKVVAPAPAPAPSEVTPPAEPADAVAVETEKSAAESAEAATPTEAEMRELATTNSAQPEKPAKPAKKPRRNRGAGSDAPPFGSHRVPAGQNWGEAVSLFGSTKVEGTVDAAAVSIFGNTTVDGHVRGEAVSVMGTTTINGKVDGEAVAVFGDIVLGPDAVVGGEVVAVLGQVIRSDGAEIRGGVQEIGGFGPFVDFEWLRAWVTKCLLWGRPLAFGGHLGWAWMVGGIFLVFYMLLALLFPRGIDRCVENLEQRPGGTFLAAVLAALLTPVLIVLLVITGVGIVLIPFVLAGLFFGTLFGKAAMLAWFGRRVTRLFGDGFLSHAFVAVFIGGVLVLLLYTIPFLGFLLWKLFAVLGMGMVVYTLALTMKANRPARPAAAPAASGGFATAVPVAPVGVAAGEPGVPPVVGADGSPLGATAAPLFSASTLPRAGFWIRTAAAVLDFMLIGITTGFLDSLFDFSGPGFLFFSLATYSAVLWKHKGTTIGGIICGLKVVRLDDQPIDWGVAIVRSLSAFLSLAVAGLGFIWVAFDDEKQSWHDKIAGTTIVKVPKGTSLL